MIQGYSLNYCLKSRVHYIGTLTLDGANTFTGGLTISNGILQIGSGGTSGSIANQTITNNAALVFNRSDNITLINSITGSGSVEKAGSGTLTLTGNNTYSGTTTISTGTLQIGAGGTSGTLGSGSVVTNATLSFNRSDSLTVGNIISGTGGISHIGAGRLDLMGDNTYAGGTRLNNGASTHILGLGHKNALGTGTIKLDVTGRVEALVDLSGADGILNDVIFLGTQSFFTVVGSHSLDIGGDITVGGTRTANAITNSITGGGVLTLSGTITNTTRSKTLDIFGNASTIISGIIQDGIGHDGSVITLTLSKSNAGTLTLSGANTYTGNTAVLGGTLVVGGATVGNPGLITSSPLGTGVVTVNSGSALDLAGYEVANALTLSGMGFSNSGAVYNSSSNAAGSAGAITLAGSTTIKNNGALILDANVSGAHALTVVNTGKVTFGGSIGSSSTKLSSRT